MAVLEIVDLYKVYEGNVAVDHLSLTVQQGEFVTLLGPSGCGKTTTLRAIAGLVEIDGGEIRFDGRLMNDVPAYKRSTAMVFQSYALFPHMTIAENISFGLRMRKVPKPEMRARVADAMAMVGLEGLAKRKPTELSGGQQQRVALARAIVTQPEVLLFDEPLSNLDAKLRERLRVEIRDLQRRLGITAIYVTHDQTEALVISDRIVVMNRGRIDQMGEPLAVYRHPATPFTAEFIGQANLVPATVVSAGPDGTVLQSPVGRLLTATRLEPGMGEVQIAWRPEDVVPFRDGQHNRISATVANILFMGNLTQIMVSVGDTTIQVERPGAVAWAVGDTVELSVAPDRIEVLR